MQGNEHRQEQVGIWSWGASEFVCGRDDWDMGVGALGWVGGRCVTPKKAMCDCAKAAHRRTGTASLMRGKNWRDCANCSEGVFEL